MSEQKKAFYIKDLIDSVKMYGEITGPIWTGFPLREVFGDFSICKDDFHDIEYKRILEDYEKTIIEYRQGASQRTGRENIDLFEKIRLLNDELRKFQDYNINNDVLFIGYIITYEKIRAENPREIKKLEKKVKDILENMLNDSKKFEDPIRKAFFDTDLMKMRVRALLTKDQERKFIVRSNINQIKKLITEVTGNEHPTNDEIIKYLMKFSEPLFISDSMGIFKNQMYGMEVYVSILYNYLIELYKQDIQKPLDQRKYPELTLNYILGIDDYEELFDLVLDKYEYNEQLEPELHAKLQTNYILDNLDFIDIKKLFMLYLIRTLESLDSMQILYSDEQINHSDYSDSIKFITKIDMENEKNEIYKICEEKKKLLQAILKVGKFQDNYICRGINVIVGEQMQNEISISYVKNKMKRFQGNLYLSSTIIDYIKRAIFLYKSQTFLNDDNLIKRLEWKDEEIESLAAVDNIIFNRLIELGLVKKDCLKEVALKIKNGQIENVIKSAFPIEDNDRKIDFKDITLHNFINTNVRAGNIPIQELLDIYYSEEIIQDEDFDDLELNEEGIKEVVNQEKLLEVYKIYSSKMASHLTNSNKEDEVEINKLRRMVHIYTKLFNQYYLNDLSKEEKDAVKKELVEDFYLELVDSGMSDEEINPLISFTISEMLDNNFIDYEMIDKTSFMETYITELRKRNNFSLEDTSKIKEALGNNRCKEIIDEIIKSKELSQNQKYSLIMDFFFKNSDMLIRDELVGKLDFFAPEFYHNTGNIKSSRNKSKSGNSPLDSNGQKPTKYVKHLYRDGIRWEFYHSFVDLDIKATTYSNGYVEFYSPRLGKRFIEKFYNVDRKTGQIISPGYGVATCVIDDDIYIKNKNKLVETNSLLGAEAINPVVLSELVPRGKHTRIPHITQSAGKNWMRLMIGEFGSIYSQEDKALLEQRLSEYENQHEIID